MNLSQRPKLKQTLEQSHRLSPQLIQRFRLYHLPYKDLVNELKQESEDNVFIEVERDDSLLSQSSSQRSSQDALLGKDLSDYAKDDKQVPLQQYLLEQLRLISTNDKIKAIIEQLIDALDTRGYLTDYKSLKKDLLKNPDYSAYLIDQALGLLQEFEPEGVAARSLEECLTIQVKQMQLTNEALEHTICSVIETHLDALAEQEFEHIAREENIPVEGVQQIADFIKQNLNPNPGAAFSTDNFNQHVSPSFEIFFEEGQLKIINLEESQGIRFRLSDQYLKTLEDPNTDDETKAFLKAKQEKAKELLDNIRQREENLNKLVSLLAERQRLYLEKGPDFLIPLLQKSVSEQLEMPASTVSRLLSSKYARTPQGVIPLKLFCPRDYYGKTKKQFIYFIEEILKKHPKLSDNKIASLLQEKGLQIARRTVTKYRRELGLDNSYFSGRSN